MCRKGKLQMNLHLATLLQASQRTKLRSSKIGKDGPACRFILPLSTKMTPSNQPKGRSVFMGGRFMAFANYLMGRHSNCFPQELRSMKGKEPKMKVASGRG